MSEYIITILNSTNPGIITSDSPFCMGIKSEIVGSEIGQLELVNYHRYPHDEILELSKQHPSETITATTWNNEEDYNRLIETIIYNDGDYIQLEPEPDYLFYHPSKGGAKSESVNGDLSQIFCQRISEFLDRNALHKMFTLKDYRSDFLYNEKDNDGFKIYLTYVWDTEEYRFIGENKIGHRIDIKYEDRLRKQLKILRAENQQLRNQLTGVIDSSDPPFKK